MNENDGKSETTNNNEIDKNNLDISDNSIESHKEKMVTLEDIAQDIVIKEKKPRSKYISFSITLGFIFGPIFLFVDLLFPNAFNRFSFDLTIIFTIITLVFFTSSIISSRNEIAV